MNTEMLRKAVIPTSVGVAGLSVGGVLGYILGQKRAKRNYLHLVEEAEHLEEMRGNLREEIEHVYRMHTAPEMEVEKRHDITKDGRVPYYTVPVEHDTPEIKQVKIDSLTLHPGPNPWGGTVEVRQADPELEALLDEEEAEIEEEKRKRHSAFERPFRVEDDEWNWEAELNQRSNKAIYVVTRDEFFADDVGFRHSALTFYEGDRMLCDELGEPIYNWTSHVGTELPFGHGSDDENVVFIRNESLKWEYEVSRDPGRFDVEVKGHDIELAYEEEDLKHAHQPLKMRRE